MQLRKLISTILFLLFFRVAWAGEVLVLESVKIQPYQEAIEGFKSSCSCNTREIVLSEISERDVLREIRKSRPEMIAAIGIDALLKVKGIKDIPIVYLMIPNPLYRLQNEENITGISMHVSPERQLTVLQEVLPNVKRVGVLYDPAKSGGFVERLREVSKGSGVTIVLKEVHSAKDVPSILQTVVKEGIDILWMLPDTTVVTPETVEAFLDSSLNNKIPLFTFSRKYVEMGAVISVSIDPYDIGKQAGEMTRKILSGTKVTNLPRSDARKSVLGLNLKIAKKIGIDINSEAIGKAQYKIN
jgi:ABC-type uncharacterized transport system substrate-binding protein